MGTQLKNSVAFSVSWLLFLLVGKPPATCITNRLSFAVMQILEVPSLLEEGSSSVVKRNILKQQQESHAKYGARCCQ